MIATFMGGDANATGIQQAREIHEASMMRRFLGVRQRAGAKTPAGTTESGVKAMTGAGSVDGKLLSSTLQCHLQWIKVC